MDSEEFTIEFRYSGWNYTAHAINNLSKGCSSYLIYYALDISPQFEKLVEISEVVSTGNDPLEWKEVQDDTRRKKTNRGLIQAMGEAIENRDG